MDEPNHQGWLVNGVTTMGAAIPRPFRATGFILLLCIGIAGAEEKRSPKWAQPIKLEGASNLHKVSGVLYRSAQPDAAGFRNLKKMGIRTVINLRSFHSDRKKIGSA